jgi:hypothetical protein
LESQPEPYLRWELAPLAWPTILSSDKSIIAAYKIIAYKNLIEVQPKNSNLAPFTLAPAKKWKSIRIIATNYAGCEPGNLPQLDPLDMINISIASSWSVGAVSIYLMPLSPLVCAFCRLSSCFARRSASRGFFAVLFLKMLIKISPLFHD